jgi:NDP-sugar pyrophosphorylase family protein
MQCVILAGGLGTRMKPRTDVCPKTLLEVNGRPFAWYQVQWLLGQGVTDVVYCIGHMGEQIRAYWEADPIAGINIRYVDEESELRGTGGAIRLALELGELAEEFLVIYGDSYLPVEYGPVMRALRERATLAVMTVLRNEGRWDRSNVIFEHGELALYDKQPAQEVLASMKFIDYGLAALRRSVVADRIPAGVHFDLSSFYRSLSLEGRLAGFEVSERFYEIGSPAGYRDFTHYLLKSLRQASDV